MSICRYICTNSSGNVYIWIYIYMFVYKRVRTKEDEYVCMQVYGSWMFEEDIKRSVTNCWNYIAIWNGFPSSLITLNQHVNYYWLKIVLTCSILVCWTLISPWMFFCLLALALKIFDIVHFRFPSVDNILISLEWCNNYCRLQNKTNFTFWLSYSCGAQTNW